jgi:cell division protein FtsB
MSTRTAATPQVVGQIAGQVAEKRRRMRLSLRGAMLLVVVMLLLLASVAPLRNLMDQRSQLVHLQRQTAALQAKDGVLGARVNQLSDPTYISQLARQCLGMVMPGQIAFVTIPKHGAPIPPPGC